MNSRLVLQLSLFFLLLNQLLTEMSQSQSMCFSESETEFTVGEKLSKTIRRSRITLIRVAWALSIELLDWIPIRLQLGLAVVMAMQVCGSCVSLTCVIPFPLLSAKLRGSAG